MSVLACLPCRMSRGILKREFLDIYLSTFFGAENLGNTWAVRVRFFRKCSTLDVDLKNSEKNRAKRFCFWDKCIWIVCIELSPLRREYLSSAVNMLIKSLQTFHVTQRKFSKSITFIVIKEYGKGARIKI